MDVSHVGSSIPEPVIEQQTQLAGEGDQSLPAFLVLDGCSGLRAMSEIKALILLIVVLDVEGAGRTQPHHRVPEE